MRAPYGVYPARDGHVVVSLCDAAMLAEALDSDALREVAASTAMSNATNMHAGWPAPPPDLRSANWPSASTATASGGRRSTYYDDLLSDPQLVHAKVFRQVTLRGRTIHLVNHPNRYDGEVPAAARPGSGDRRAHARDPGGARLRR